MYYFSYSVFVKMIIAKESIWFPTKQSKMYKT